MKKTITKAYQEIADIVEILQTDPEHIQKDFHSYIIQELQKDPTIFNDPYKHLEVYEKTYHKVIKDYKE